MVRTVKKTKKVIKRKKNHRLLKIFLLVVVIFILWFTAQVQIKGGGVQGVMATFLGQSKQDIEALETKYILVLGISKDINANLTDTIMVAAYNPQMQKASLISLSRDMFVGNDTSTAKATDKLNSVYSSKGIDGVLNKVNTVTGLNIKDYVIVNNNALIEIVDVIGGVEFNVPIDMKYDDPTQDLHIDLKKGLQIIDGTEAEWLLRFRHNNDGTSYPASYGDNDTGRMRTQREFITEILKQTIDVKNVFKVKSLAEAIYNNVETSMEKDEIYAYITCAMNFDTDNFKTYAFPGESKKCNGLWFFVHYKEQGKVLINNMEEYLNTSIVSE